MIILGIDPGVARLGYAVISINLNNQISIINSGCLETSQKQVFPQRLLFLYQGLKGIIEKYHPEKAAIEAIYFAKNVKTAIKVSEARGIALLICAENKLEIMEFTPLQIKQALTGYGRANKEQIQKMVQITLKLKEIPKPDDVADALAIALTCAQTKSWFCLKNR